MIDYHAHTLGLEQFQQALAAAPFTDPGLVAARNQSTIDVALAGDYALLGTFLDHLLGHAASDGTELSLLRRAADLWSRGVGLSNEIGTIRAALEAALEAPSDPTSPARFNTAALDAQRLAQRLYAIQAEVISLRDDVMPLKHVAAHPRQLDTPPASWDWGNRFLGRRTDAFVRRLARLADSLPTRAFAFGALAGYGANAAASAYLGHVVGGPRRAHRYRDRIARNAVGSWLRAHYPATPAPAALAQRIRFGGPARPVLPADIEQLLLGALSETFDLSDTPPVPDLQRGYRRLVRHLELLDRFPRPAVPPPPSGVWAAALYGDPGAPPPALRTQDVGLGTDPGGGVTLGDNQPGDPQPGQSDSNSGGGICGIIVAILIVIDLIQAFVQCCVQWGKKEPCTFWDNMILKKVWEKDPPDPRDPTGPQDPNMTASGLTAAAGTPQVVQVVGALYDMHVQVWEALDRAHAYLALTGLIYPGDRIALPLYKQFTSIPAPRPWPHRPVPGAEDAYHLYPTSPLEQGVVSPSPFGEGAAPDAFLIGGRTYPTAATIALAVWQQIARGETDSPNLDLDADRGFGSPCWATDGQVDDDPIGVRVLAYGDQ
jgi:hypothetical protein